MACCFAEGAYNIYNDELCGYGIVVTDDTQRILYSALKRDISEASDVGDSQVQYMTENQRVQREIFKAALVVQDAFGFENIDPPTKLILTNDDAYMILTNWIYYYYDHGWMSPDGNKVPNDDLLREYYRNLSRGATLNVVKSSIVTAVATWSDIASDMACGDL